MSKFSIIIPVYNVESYICECLDSILAQTFQDWECICIDDGSKDGSASLIDDYARKDARIRAIHQSNGGVSSARNKGLDAASGEWICFVDGDDKVLDNWLNDICESIERHPGVDWIRTSYCNWKDENVDAVNLEECLAMGEAASTMAMRAIARLGFGWLNILSRQLIENRRFDTALSMREDSLFVMSLAPLTKGIFQSNIRGYYYRQREDSTFRKIQRIEPAIAFQRKLNELWKNASCDSKAFTQIIAKNASYCLARCVPDVKLVKELRKAIREAIRIKAFSLDNLYFERRVKFFLFLYFGWWKILRLNKAFFREMLHLEKR